MRFDNHKITKYAIAITKHHPRKLRTLVLR